jgi:hypothetical protein
MKRNGEGEMKSMNGESVHIESVSPFAISWGRDFPRPAGMFSGAPMLRKA